MSHYERGPRGPPGPPGPPGLEGSRGPRGLKGSDGVSYAKSLSRKVATKITENGQYIPLNEDETIYLECNLSGIYLISLNIIWSLTIKTDPSLEGRKCSLYFELFEMTVDDKSTDGVDDKSTETNKKTKDQDSTSTLVSISYVEISKQPGGFMERTQNRSEIINLSNSASKLGVRLRGFDFNLVENEFIIIEEISLSAIYLRT